MSRAIFRAYPGVHAARMGALNSQAATPIQAETTALLAAMTVQPGALRQQQINDMIFALKGAGLWATFDFLLVFAAHDAQAARVGWIVPSRVCTVNGAPTFTVDRGYRGDGVSASLGLGINWDTLTKYTRNNACLGVWIASDTSSSGGVIGPTTTSPRSQIAPRSLVGDLNTRVCAATSGLFPVATSKGHSLGVRTGIPGHDTYKNGAFLGNTVAASQALQAEEVVFLRSTFSYSDNHILAAAHAGSALTPEQIATLSGILQTYMAGLGI